MDIYFENLQDLYSEAREEGWDVVLIDFVEVAEAMERFEEDSIDWIVEKYTQQDANEYGW